ncbi:hypothetical protein M0813_28175 [Anaeramoeba flamelloides]|uniref:Uncharacterized protein n=1 Tax=Anaeramoeba flamelloides TaxID=1746091 RepID=A0ABQ8XV68_9EUKA|nr:hypothetical protein M0813_28175 [Anaeramoeba flamelloides]
MFWKNIQFFKNFYHETLLVPWFLEKRKHFKAILTVRVVMFLWTLTVILRDFILYPKKNYWPTYFTHWTWVIQCAYQFCISVCSYKLLKLWKKHENASSFQWIPAEWPMTKKFKALAVLWETVFATSILVTGFYWALLYDPKKKTNIFEGLLPHGINTIWTLVEFLFNRDNFPFVRWAFFLPYGIVYVAFYVIIFYTTDYLPYSILHPGKSDGWIWFLMVFVLSYIILGVGKLLAWLRDTHWEKTITLNEIDNGSLLKFANQYLTSSDSNKENEILDVENSSSQSDVSD